MVVTGTHTKKSSKICLSKAFFFFLWNFNGDSYRITHRPKLHREFHAVLKDLPKTYSAENKQRFYQLIDTFGTHYIDKVHF